MLKNGLLRNALVLAFALGATGCGGGGIQPGMTPDTGTPPPSPTSIAPPDINSVGKGAPPAASPAATSPGTSSSK